MTLPYTPIVLAQAIVNPGIGGTGAPPIAYLSNSVYEGAPTAVDSQHLYPGGTTPQNIQTLADTLRRASKLADAICFGADPAAKGVSLAASLSVESVFTTIKLARGGGPELRLICDYKPVLEVIGIDVGANPGSVQSIGATVAASTRIDRRTIKVPWGFGPLQGRPNDTIPSIAFSNGGGGLYAVWSYVNGYPHTTLQADVTANATSCVVQATDGNGGVWGVMAASGSFPGTQLQVFDGANTEQVFVTSITPATPSAGLCTLGTSAFANSHSLPELAPDFIPVSAIPEDVQQGVIWVTNMLIKTKGTRAIVMPSSPGQAVPAATKKALAQAGALDDFTNAMSALTPYMIRSKAKV